MRPELLRPATAMLTEEWRPTAELSPDGEIGPVVVTGRGGAGATVAEAALAWAATPEAAAFLVRPTELDAPRGPAWAAVNSALGH